MAIDISKLQIDSRDYVPIFKDLIEAVPNISQIWNTNDENDPGVALIKLMAMDGDMLSYNHDKAVLESYPLSVTQRKNAAQIFGLLGYKMHWYQSARCDIQLTNLYTQSITIPKFTTFTTSENNIVYTYLGNNESIAPSGSGGSLSSYQIEAVQGIPRTPSLKSDQLVPLGSEAWHSIYNFNIFKEDIVDNKIFIEDSTIDESSIILLTVDDNRDENYSEWKQVSNIDALTNTGKFFELKIDSDDKPYIELVPYWENFKVSKFKLFYLVSAGVDGQIASNAFLQHPTSNVVLSAADPGTNKHAVISNEYIVVSNTSSTYGYNYETAEEARDNSATYINTYDTLITLDDFEKATKRIDGVANCIATDRTCDPNPAALEANDIKIYVTKTEEYADVPDVDFETTIINFLKSKKLMPLNIGIDFESITEYNWSLNGTVYLKEQVDLTTAQNIANAIDRVIKLTYAKANVGYNQVIGLSGLLSVIMAASPLILNIDVDSLEYYTYDDQVPPVKIPASKLDITGRYSINTTASDVTNTYTLNAPIKPGSLMVSFNNGLAMIMDDKAGGLGSDSAMFNSGSINYATGELSITFTSALANPDITITYQKNVINIVTVDTMTTVGGSGNLVIANECIKYG